MPDPITLAFVWIMLVIFGPPVIIRTISTIAAFIVAFLFAAFLGAMALFGLVNAILFLKILT